MLFNKLISTISIELKEKLYLFRKGEVIQSVPVSRRINGMSCLKGSVTLLLWLRM